MSFTDLSPRNRRIVVTVSSDDLYILENDEAGVELLGKAHTTVLAIDKEPELSNFTLLGEGGGRFQSGLILMLSPFNDSTYVKLSEARSAIAIEKMQLTTRLCQILGAKSVNIKRIEITDEEQGANIKFEVDIAEVSGQLESKRAELKYLSRSIQTKATFRGSEVVDEEKATAFLKNNRLNSDQVLRNLVRMRTDSNPLTTITQEISLTNSLQSSFELLTSLGLPKILETLHLPTIRSTAGVEKISKEKVEITSTLEIMFSN